MNTSDEDPWGDDDDAWGDDSGRNIGPEAGDSSTKKYSKDGDRMEAGDGHSQEKDSSTSISMSTSNSTSAKKNNPEKTSKGIVPAMSPVQEFDIASPDEGNTPVAGMLIKPDDL
ncbi:unnamed protein product, partial [Amoebophrya sp. A25]|eukprot:GSA25T00002944001.1